MGAFVDHLERWALARILADTRPGVVADVGAGTGHFTRLLADRHRVVAVEPSRAMLDEGRCHLAGQPISCREAFGERLPLADQAFEGVVILTTLEWAGDPQRYVDEARRVTRPRVRPMSASSPGRVPSSSPVTTSNSLSAANQSPPSARFTSPLKPRSHGPLQTMQAAKQATNRHWRCCDGI